MGKTKDDLKKKKKEILKEEIQGNEEEEAKGIEVDNKQKSENPEMKETQEIKEIIEENQAPEIKPKEIKLVDAWVMNDQEIQELTNFQANSAHQRKADGKIKKHCGFKIVQATTTNYDVKKGTIQIKYHDQHEIQEYKLVDFLDLCAADEKKYVEEWCKAFGIATKPYPAGKKWGGSKPLQQQPYSYYEDEIDKNITAGQGWYYHSKTPQTAEFRPSKFKFGKLWFKGWRTQDLNDCVIHSINYAVGYACFQCREQAVNVIKRRMHKSADVVTYLKAQKGISMTYLKDIVADLNHLYSLENVYGWQKSPQELEPPDLLALIKAREESAIIMLYRGEEDNTLFNHVVTIKRYNNGIALLDSANRAIHYTHPKVKTQVTWNIKTFLQNVSSVELYVFKQDKYDEATFKYKMQLLEAEMRLGKREIPRANNISSKRNKKSKGKRFTKQRKIKQIQVEVKAEKLDSINNEDDDDIQI